jgi:hypothetical protein
MNGRYNNLARIAEYGKNIRQKSELDMLYFPIIFILPHLSNN